MQILFDVILFKMNSEAAIEAPRFETRHLVSSFDNHAMNPGDLQLDDRTPSNVIIDLAGRGHKVATRTRWNSGSAPGLVRMTPGGVVEAGADPFGYRSMRAW
jgi:gamma-glutamyltranspeptidase/glutathione hydrolase